MLNLKDILCQDFCPGLNRYVYWLKQPFGWIAIGAVAALPVAISVSASGWWVLASCLALVAIQLVWPWFQIKVCDCQIVFDRLRAVEGEEIPVQLKITNRGPFPVWGMAIEKGFAQSSSG
ncbi:MAG: hypothetical protein GY743_20090, partial [Planctomycetaceae bacterium]|nr:hypothetical protein [Planctomycetaceae bacterium]